MIDLYRSDLIHVLCSIRIWCEKDNNAHYGLGYVGL